YTDGDRTIVSRPGKNFSKNQRTGQSHPQHRLRYRTIAPVEPKRSVANISEQRIAANISVFIVISKVWDQCGRLLPVQARPGKSPVVRRHRGQMDRRKKRGFKSSTNVTQLAAVLRIPTRMIAETYPLKGSGTKLRSRSPLFEIPLVLVRLDHI